MKCTVSAPVLVALALLVSPGCAPGMAPANAGETGPPAGHEVALFAGGCFWCLEPPFEKLDGVYDVVSGFSGGTEKNPTYEQVSSGRTGHREVVRVRFDPKKVSYETLLDVFWKQIDPTDDGGQFADRGPHYRTGIFYYSAAQREAAQRSKDAMAQSGKFEAPLVTEILEAGPFYPAENYHQDFYEKDSARYKSYRDNSGRTPYLKSVWGDGEKAVSTKKDETAKGAFEKPPQTELRSCLTPLQYRVTQEAGTEPPFANDLWNEKRDGIYVDIVSGEALFSSKDKFDSGTGWPSFTKPLAPENVVEHEDSTLGMERTEVRSVQGDSHLGHVFPDGPGPDGLRYCINSASLRFIPKEDLEKEGYGRYLKLFK